MPRPKMGIATDELRSRTRVRNDRQCGSSRASLCHALTESGEELAAAQLLVSPAPLLRGAGVGGVPPSHSKSIVGKILRCSSARTCLRISAAE